MPKRTATKRAKARTPPSRSSASSSVLRIQIRSGRNLTKRGECWGGGALLLRPHFGGLGRSNARQFRNVSESGTMLGSVEEASTTSSDVRAAKAQAIAPQQDGQDIGAFP